MLPEKHTPRKIFLNGIEEVFLAENGFEIFCEAGFEFVWIVVLIFEVLFNVDVQFYSRYQDSIESLEDSIVSSHLTVLL